MSPAVEGDRHGLEVGQRLLDDADGAAQPPLDVGGGAGPERPEPSTHELGPSLGRLHRLGYLAQPGGHGRPLGSGDAPVAAVATAGDQRLQAELGQDPGRHRHVGAVGLADGDVDAPLQLGQLLAQLLRRQLAAVRQPGEHGGARPVDPGGAVLGDPTGLDVLGQPGPELGGEPGARAPPRGRQQVAREDEDGAPHGQLLDQAALLVERPVDVGDREVVDPGVQGEVDGRRLGGVQHRHRLGRGDRVGVPRAGHDAVAGRDPGPPLVVGHVPHAVPRHGAILPERTDTSSARRLP